MIAGFDHIFTYIRNYFAQKNGTIIQMIAEFDDIFTYIRNYSTNGCGILITFSPTFATMI